MPWHPQILANQLTLSQPGEADYAQHINTGTPGFSDLPTALYLIWQCWLWSFELGDIRLGKFLSKSEQSHRKFVFFKQKDAETTKIGPIITR